MATELNDILRVTALMQNVTSGALANVFLVKVTTKTSSPLSDAQTLLDMGQYMDDLYSNINAAMDNETAFDVVNVFNVTQDRPLGNTAWPVLTMGLHADQPLPSQCACFLQGNTGFSKSWARKFLGAFTEAHCGATGKIENTLLSQLLNFAADWLLGYTSAGSDVYTPVVYSSKVMLYRTIIEVVIRNIWATIRRRRIGRGA